jgi:Holliday junction resolvasome RuvABC endonuclease subunit
MKLLSIDPGAVSGSYAVKTPDGVYVGDLPVADGGVVPRAFYDFVVELQPDIAVVELVGPRPGQSATSGWKFAYSVGVIMSVLACAGIRTERLTPQKWKKRYGLAGKASDPEVKGKTRATAMRLYPTVTGLERAKDHNRADALLMLDYWLMEKNRDSAA